MNEQFIKQKEKLNAKLRNIYRLKGFLENEYLVSFTKMVDCHCKLHHFLSNSQLSVMGLNLFDEEHFRLIDKLYVNLKTIKQQIELIDKIEERALAVMGTAPQNKNK